MKERKRSILIALPGLHAEQRGAETAMEAVASGLAMLPGTEVTVVGSGPPKDGTAYRYLQATCRHRSHFEHWPRGPMFRNETSWEELTFCWSMLRTVDPGSFDVRITCSFPFVNFLTRAMGSGGRGLNLFVTQNGDWPCHRSNAEFRLFGADGLVCTNPDYFDAHRSRYCARLIPNGVDPLRFFPGEVDRGRLGLPSTGPIVLMVSALIPSKRVLEGIRAASGLNNVNFVVAGDGPLRGEVDQYGASCFGDRFRRVTVAREQMPDLYRCSDVMLHMSKDEPSANAYIEALATGVPIVTQDRRVTRWTLQDTSYLVDTDNDEAVSQALGAALSESDGAAVSIRTSLVNRRFRWEAIAAQYLKFIEDLESGSRLSSGTTGVAG